MCLAQSRTQQKHAARTTPGPHFLLIHTRTLSLAFQLTPKAGLYSRTAAYRAGQLAQGMLQGTTSEDLLSWGSFYSLLLEREETGATTKSHPTRREGEPRPSSRISVQSLHFSHSFHLQTLSPLHLKHRAVSLASQINENTGPLTKRGLYV